MIKQYVQLWSYLAPLHRLGAVALTVGNLLASVLEVLGLALFGAVLLRLTQGASVLAGLPGIPGLLQGVDLRTLTVWCAVVYVAKNAVMIALTWLEARFTFGVQSHLTVQALAAILRQDYEEASRTSASAKINLLAGGMYALAFSVLLPGLALVAEAILMLALVLFLVLTQPTFVSGMLVALCAVAGVLVLVSRRLVLRLGASRHRSEDDRLQLLSGIFGHLREMYVYAAGPRAVAHLQSLLTRLAADYRAFQILLSAPRFVLEVSLVLVLLAVVFWQGDAGRDSALVVSIGVFGVAGFRLLLGINRVVTCVQAMRFAGPTIERITQALGEPCAVAQAAWQHPSAPARTPRPAGQGSLRLAGVSYAYEAGKPVLQGVELELRRCSLVAVRGRSGAGKSTLLEVMAGLRTPGEGWVEFDGVRIAHKQQLVGRVAYAGQQPALFPDTIRANVALGLDPDAIDDAAIWRALERARLEDVVRALPGGLDHRLGLTPALSGGQVQRLALARALYRECEYLLLDEPTAALDAETEVQLLETLRELAATTGVLVVSHRSAPVEAADAVLELAGGRLVVDRMQRAA